MRIMAAEPERRRNLVHTQSKNAHRLYDERVAHTCYTSGCTPTQASIAPLLPCDAERLADLLDTAVDWVVVSSFRDDGGAGSKTRTWAAELYRQHGYGDYRHDGDQHAAAVIETLRRRLGSERVRVGKDGFDQVCRELGVDAPVIEQGRLF